MEVESMHSAIDSARKNLKISAPSEWPIVLQMARRKNPYHVHEVDQKDIFDLHHLSKDVGMNNVRVDTDGRSVNWMKIKSIKVEKGKVDEIQVKEEYSESYRRIMIGKAAGRKTRKQSTIHNASIDASLLRPAYSKKLLISASKKADLVKLCTSGIIPSKYHDFYSSIPASSTVKDCLPQPDSSEALDCNEQFQDG